MGEIFCKGSVSSSVSSSRNTWLFIYFSAHNDTWGYESPYSPKSCTAAKLIVPSCSKMQCNSIFQHRKPSIKLQRTNWSATCADTGRTWSRAQILETCISWKAIISLGALCSQFSSEIVPDIRRWRFLHQFSNDNGDNGNGGDDSDVVRPQRSINHLWPTTTPQLLQISNLQSLWYLFFFSKEISERLVPVGVLIVVN